MVFNNSILLGAAAAQGGGFYPQTIEQSLKFNDDDSQYLSWTPAAAGNRKLGLGVVGSSVGISAQHKIFLLQEAMLLVNFQPNLQ
jgi:hypothetical protein